MNTLPWSQTTTGIRLTVRLTPRGGRDALEGAPPDGTRSAHLFARVASPPVDGTANPALLKHVARTLRIPKSAVTLVAGETARIKTLEIAGDPSEPEQALATLI